MKGGKLGNGQYPPTVKSNEGWKIGKMANIPPQLNPMKGGKLEKW